MYVADTKRLTAAGARKIADTAIARAREAGMAVTVAVADAGGHLLLLERMEGGRFHTVHSATTKAVTAASNRRQTGSTGAQGQALDTIHALGPQARGLRREIPLPGGGELRGDPCRSRGRGDHQYHPERRAPSDHPRGGSSRQARVPRQAHRQHYLGRSRHH